EQVGAADGQQPEIPVRGLAALGGGFLGDALDLAEQGGDLADLVEPDVFPVVHERQGAAHIAADIDRVLGGAGAVRAALAGQVLDAAGRGQVRYPPGRVRDVVLGPVAPPAGP